MSDSDTSNDVMEEEMRKQVSSLERQTSRCSKNYSKSINQKDENQVVRCTEITCVYTSSDQLTKSESSEINLTDESKQKLTKITPRWQRIVNANLDMDKDILLEIDTGQTFTNDLKDVQAIELVVAVQSAIEQRQQLIEEWKSKTLSLTDQVEKLQHEKLNLESMNLSKESELEALSRKWNELQKHYQSLLYDSNKLKKQFDRLRCDHQTLLDTYNTAFGDINQNKHKLELALKQEQILQTKLQEQTELTEAKSLACSKVEQELKDAKCQLQSLRNILDNTSKELLGAKHSLGDQNQIQMKLADFKNNYLKLKNNYAELEVSFNKQRKDNSSLSETISKLKLMIETLDNDKNELVLTIQTLNSEKNSILERNMSMVKELNAAKQSNANVQRELKVLQSEVNIYKEKIAETEKCNMILCEQINFVKDDNRSLGENLKKTKIECNSLSEALAESQCQLELQQTALLKVEAKMKAILNEKSNLENMINEMRGENVQACDDVQKLIKENANFKLINSDLMNQLNAVNLELNECRNEIQCLNNEIEQLKATIVSEKEKHENYVHKLQEKVKKKSREWKDYVTKEIERLRNKRRADINAYLEINRDLENRLCASQESKAVIEEKLTCTINELSKKLDLMRCKLEETIYKAKQEQAELMDKYNSDTFKLKEELDKKKLESQWINTELEAKIQEMMHKRIDDEETIKLLERENETLKENLRTISEELESLSSFKKELGDLFSTKQVLESELKNCQALLRISEETNLNLKQENTELRERLKTELDDSKIIRTKIVKLKKIIGKKDAQINVLQNTITQLKEQLTGQEEENSKLKVSVSQLECNQTSLLDRLQSLNADYEAAKREIEAVSVDKKTLVNSLKKIESQLCQYKTENSDLKNNLEQAKKYHQDMEKALEDRYATEEELKEKIVVIESNALKSSHEAKQLEKKVTELKQYIIRLESDLANVNESHQQKDSNHKSEVNELQTKLDDANQEISNLKGQLNNSEKRVKNLKKSLKLSYKYIQQLVNQFDRLRQTICQVLSLSFVYPPSVDLSSCNDVPTQEKELKIMIEMYAEEVDVYVENLNNLQKTEMELNSKLVVTKKDFEKLSAVMRELQDDYTKKVEKLYRCVKEKDEIIKNLEQELVKMQVESVEGDKSVYNSFSDKIEDQHNKINKLQQEKANLQNEILCLSTQINSMEGSVFELTEKLKLYENKNSKLQLKNVSLEGDLEKLTLLLKEARDKDHDQLCQFKQMMLANRELMDRVRTLKQELEKESKELENLRIYCHNKSQDQKYFYPKQSNNEKELEHKVKVLTEKLLLSQKAEHEAKSTLFELESNLNHFKKQLSVALSEKANLEGWVSHLQQLISGGYIADSALPQHLAVAEEEKATMQKTIESLRENLCILTEDKRLLKHTVENLTNCNKNLEVTIVSISKNKDKLEKELRNLKKKFELLCDGLQSNECNVTELSTEIQKLMHKAHSMSKAVKCKECDYHSSQDYDSPHDCRFVKEDVKTISYPPKVTSEESMESYDVSIGCKIVECPMENIKSCCVKESKDEYPRDYSPCRRYAYIEKYKVEHSHDEEFETRGSSQYASRQPKTTEEENKTFV